VEPVVVTGAVVSAGAYPLGTTLSEEAFRAQSCTVSRLELNGEIFYQCGPSWFRMTYAEGEFIYVVVKPPAG
jgi:hypothetical protein